MHFTTLWTDVFLLVCEVISGAFFIIVPFY